MRTRISIIVAAVVLAAAAPGCGESDSGESKATAEKPARPDVKRSVVLVEGIYPDKTTTVSGVVFETQRGLVLTGNHAVEAAPKINVRLSDGNVTHAVAVARAQCHDLAVLKLTPKPPGIQALPIADSSGASIGQPVASFAYQLTSASGRGPALSRVQGTISGTGIKAEFKPLPPTGPFIAHQTPLVSSAAGSPLIDGQGRMIGLNTLVGHPREPDLPGIEYALTSSYIRARLRQLRRGKGGALGGWEAEHNACHAALRNLVGIGHVHQPSAKGAAGQSSGGSSGGGAGGAGTGSGTGGGTGGGGGAAAGG
jgi:S1-C subfamily serine protease